MPYTSILHVYYKFHLYVNNDVPRIHFDIVGYISLRVLSIDTNAISLNSAANSSD